jgi:hypothetical protein
LREVGVEPTVIGSEDSLKGAVPLIHSRCYVVKLHGDYLDTRILNTEAELSVYSPSINTLLDRIIDEHGLIVSGWSGDSDAALRDAITRAPNRRYPMFWAARGTPSAVAADIITHRAGMVIVIDSADTFFETLARLVSGQADAKKQTPQSIELMVTSTKRYLAKPEFRIQLDELIGQEARKLDRLLQTPDFALTGTFSKELITQRVAHFESAAEPLVRIAGILGRWGTGAELRSITDLLAQFGVRESAGGLNVLINLRAYPAVLILYGYGLGLLAARRYADLFKLFSFPLVAVRDSTTTVVGHLLLGAWAGGENEIWRLLPDLEKRKTALSDHLHEVFQSWSTDYLFAPANYTQLFEEFELLGSLAFIALGNDKATLQAALNGQGGSNFVWAPIGRVSWDGQTHRRILDRWNSREIKTELVKAEFSRTDQEYLDLALKSIGNFAGRMRW